jgi:small subunit ribosomal protein S2
MQPFIFGRRNQIHIIDLKETVKGLLRARRFLAAVARRGDDVLFVGTKRQARQTVREYAERANMPYVSERWLGGTLTNFQTVLSRLGRLQELERMEADGSWEHLSKKLVSSLRRELLKGRRNLGGLRNLKSLPGALVIVDPRHEHNAVREAGKLGIPIVALADTDSNPEPLDIVIPGNDDALRSVQLVTRVLIDAVAEGVAARRTRVEPERPSRPRQTAPRPRPPASEPAAAAAAAGETPAAPRATEGPAAGASAQAEPGAAAPGETATPAAS